MFSRPFYNRGLSHGTSILGERTKNSRINLRRLWNLARCICRNMNTKESQTPGHFDQAAVFASAMSLWEECHEHAKRNQLNLSECFNGIDQLMRVVMRIGNQFETWSCQHIDFKELADHWPYLLQDKFGQACLAIAEPKDLESFGDRDCLHAAMRMRLPVILGDKLPVPVDVIAPNPTPNSAFRSFRIQTVRTSIEDGDVSVYSWDDEPFDGEFGEPYFGLYGVYEDGTVEHIADRRSYLEAGSLAQKLAPGIDFPTR
jgi:hypothetical protein